MFLVLYGKDSFSLRERLKALEAELGIGDALAAGVSVFAAADTTPEEVEAACLTAPLLGGARLVVLEGLLDRVEEARRRAWKEPDREPPQRIWGLWTRLASVAATMPPTSHLVLVDGEIKPDNPLLGQFKKAPGVRIESYRGIPPASLPAWIAGRAQRQGVDLSPAALRSLADLSGGDLWALTRELEKLALYAGDRRVEEADVQALVADARPGRIFALVDQVATGQHAAALRSLRRLFAEGASVPYVLSMLGRQFRLLALARDLLDEGVRADGAAQQLPLPEYVGRRIVQQAGRFSMAALRIIYRRLVEADLDVKRGRGDPELRLELLVGELAALARPGASLRGQGSKPRG